MGIFCAGDFLYYHSWTAVFDDLPFWARFSLLRYAAAAAFCFFLFFCILIFWQMLAKLLTQAGVFRDVSAGERRTYALMLFVLLGLMAFVFLRSDAFYSRGRHDIIYTNDSFQLVTDCAYTFLTHVENDIRQPLFAVFSAPFTGWVYFFTWLLGLSKPAYAALLNVTQVILLFAGSLFLAKALGLTAGKRRLFMVLNWCTYPPLLFSLMIEQYVTAYFWLMLLLLLLTEKPCPNRLAMCGAVGTLTPGVILFPALSDRSFRKQPSSWLNDTVKSVLILLAVILAFGRMDILLDTINATTKLSRFSTLNDTASVTFSGKLVQYTQFLRSCLAAPPAVITTADGYAYWRQADPTFTLWGPVILALCALSAVLDRKKTLARLAALWLLMSVVLLLFIGWGAPANGLILYTLYFSWAVLALLWMLIDRMARHVRRFDLTAAAAAAGAAILAAVNLPQLWAMIRFALEYYPV